MHKSHYILVSRNGNKLSDLDGSIYQIKNHLPPEGAKPPQCSAALLAPAVFALRKALPRAEVRPLLIGCGTNAAILCTQST